MAAGSGGNFRSPAGVLGAVNELGAALLDGFRAARRGGSAATTPGAAAELLLTLDERGKGAEKWSS